MAVLFNCRLCGGLVASDARICPHCGTPNFQPEITDNSFAVGIHFEFNHWHEIKNCDILHYKKVGIRKEE